LDRQLIPIIKYRVNPIRESPCSMISQIFSTSEIYMFIAEITSLVQVVIWYEYLVKFSPLIFADHCRYHNIFKPLINTVFNIYQQLRSFSISWRYHRFYTGYNQQRILDRLPNKKAWTFNVNPRFIFHRS